MKENFLRSLNLVLKEEGGYVWDKRDPGGETNMGVTRAAWQGYLGRPVHDGEMKALTTEEITPFYKKEYWDRCQCDNLGAGVDYAVFDFAVNAGVSQSIKFLQEALGENPDGVIGPKTIQALKTADDKDIIQKFSDVKTRFYKGLKIFPIYGKGWLARVDRTKAVADTMVA